MNEIEKQENEIEVPSGTRGFEEPTDRSDLLIPRAKLMQALSPELEANSELKPGMVVNSVTGDILPAEFVPVFKFTTWMKFNPRNPKEAGFDPDHGPGEMLWRTNDPKDERTKEAEFGADGSKPTANKIMNFFSCFVGVDFPVIVSFTNTSYKTGKKLYSLCRFQNTDMFRFRYKLASKLQKNELGQFFVYDVGLAGKSTDEEYSKAEGLWETFRNKDLKVHDETSDSTGSERPF